MITYLRILAESFNDWNSQACAKYKVIMNDPTILSYSEKIPDKNPLYVWVCVEHDFISLEGINREEAKKLGMIYK